MIDPRILNLCDDCNVVLQTMPKGHSFIVDPSSIVKYLVEKTTVKVNPTDNRHKEMTVQVNPKDCKIINVHYV